MSTWMIGVKFCLFTFIFLGVVNLGVAQSNKPPVRTIPVDEKSFEALLSEVRLLRVITERGQVRIFRAQITLERIRIQREHVDRLARQLEEKQNDLQELRRSREADKERVKEIEERNKLRPSEDPEKDRELLAELQRDIESKYEEEQTKHQQQELMAASLQSEQAKLDDLHKRLDAIEVEIENSSQGTPKKPRS